MSRFGIVYGKGPDHNLLVTETVWMVLYEWVKVCEVKRKFVWRSEHDGRFQMTSMKETHRRMEWFSGVGGG